MKSSHVRAALIFGLLPLYAHAHTTKVAQYTPALNPNVPSTMETEATIPQAPAALDQRFYIHGGVGGMESSSSDSYRENSFGLSLNLSAGGYLTHRWMLGAFYREAYSTNADMGFFGGSSYASDFYGLENEVALYQGDKNEFRMGAKTGRVKVQGVATALWLPYSTMKMTTWAVGPTMSYYHFFKPKFGLGVDISYLEIIGKDAMITDSNGTHTAHASSFGVADIGFTVQFRFH